MEDKIIPLANVLDKGYRCTIIMYRHGEQRVLQPISAIKNKRWTDKEALTTASIASVRSENERAVKLLKTSDLIKCGIEFIKAVKV